MLSREHTAECFVHTTESHSQTISQLGKSTHERLTREEKRKARLTQLRDLFEVPESLEQDWSEY